MIAIADPADEVDPSRPAAQPGGWLAEVGIVIEARAAIGGGMDSGRPGLETWASARGLDGGPSWWLLTAIGIVDGELDRLRRERARERTREMRDKRKGKA